jgi:hypothetical protein
MDEIMQQFLLGLSTSERYDSVDSDGINGSLLDEEM